MQADENYAREVMQLFTIGLWKLNADGTQQLDGSGNPISTYSQADVKNLANVFTGWASHPQGSDSGDFAWTYDQDYMDPMVCYNDHHDPEAKTIVGGVQIAAGGTCTSDMQNALDTLFNHANTAPFISKQLIQRLVTSNPSPGYVGASGGGICERWDGVRGNLLAVAKRYSPIRKRRTMGTAAGSGKLREPVLRLTGLWRAFSASQSNGLVNDQVTGNATSDFGENSLESPTVFNFFTPTYQRAGPLSTAGLVVPEFQITNEYTIVATANELEWQAYKFVSASGNAGIGVDQVGGQGAPSRPTWCCTPRRGNLCSRCGNAGDAAWVGVHAGSDVLGDVHDAGQLRQRDSRDESCQSGDRSDFADARFASIFGAALRVMTMKKDLSRRDFLQLSAGALVTSSVLSLGAAPRAFGATGPSGYKALVCLLLNGGNNGHNWVVPMSSSAYSVYATGRQSLALAANSFLPLNGTASNGVTYGLHPSCLSCGRCSMPGMRRSSCNVGPLMQPTTAAQAIGGSVQLAAAAVLASTTSRPNGRRGCRKAWCPTAGAGRLRIMFVSQGYTANLAFNISVGGSSTWQQGQVTNPYTLGVAGAPVLSATAKPFYRNNLRVASHASVDRSGGGRSEPAGQHGFRDLSERGLQGDAGQ